MLPETSEPSDTIQIFVINLRGKALVLTVHPEDTVQHLKALIQQREGVPAAEQRLIFTTRQLEEEGTLADYHIRHESTIHLLLRLHSCRRCQKESHSSSISSRELIIFRCFDLGSGLRCACAGSDEL